MIRYSLCSHNATRDITPPFRLLLRKAPLSSKHAVDIVNKAGHEPGQVGLAPCK